MASATATPSITRPAEYRERAELSVAQPPAGPPLAGPPDAEDDADAEGAADACAGTP